MADVMWFKDGTPSAHHTSRRAFPDEGYYHVIHLASDEMRQLIRFPDESLPEEP